MAYTSDAADGFTTGQISDVNEGVIERGVDVRDAENEFSFSDLRTEGYSLFLLYLDLLGRL
jgi:hypothetical protein